MEEEEQCRRVWWRRKEGKWEGSWSQIRWHKKPNVASFNIFPERSQGWREKYILVFRYFFHLQTTYRCSKSNSSVYAYFWYKSGDLANLWFYTEIEIIRRTNGWCPHFSSFLPSRYTSVKFLLAPILDFKYFVVNFVYRKYWYLCKKLIMF